MRAARVAVVEALGFMAEAAEVSGAGVFAEAASTAVHIARAVMPAVAIAAHMAEGMAGIAALMAMVDMGVITAMPDTATAIPAGTAVAADGAPPA
jgi:hypothetical protein